MFTDIYIISAFTIYFLALAGGRTEPFFQTPDSRFWNPDSRLFGAKIWSRYWRGAPLWLYVVQCVGSLAGIIDGIVL